ncbi:hypothetical protein ACNOYE_00895 [Nannocystaceae bacterium ST9]
MRQRATALPFSLLFIVSSACAGEDDPGGDDEIGDSTTDESGDSSSDSEPACVPGEQIACDCPEGLVGVQECLADGSGYGECGECIDPDPDPICGDALCDPRGEDCSSCAEDCGICLDCAEAPSCEGAAVPGVIDVHLDALDLLPEGGDAKPLELAAALAEQVAEGGAGVRMIAAALDEPARDGRLEHPLVPALREVFAEHPSEAAIVRRQLARAGLDSIAGYRSRFPDPRLHPSELGPTTLTPPPAAAPEDCEPAKLRVRLATITVHDEADLVFKDTIYCAIISEAGAAAELRVTPTTFALDTGDQYVYALAEGVVWGQLGEPVDPQGNLLMTYNCLEADDTAGFEEFLAAIADASEGLGGIPGVNGWVFPVIGLAADVIAAALALETDNHLFNASQVIPAELHLSMTTGVWWSVERTGTFNLKDWDWELRMEAWGCTDDGTL